MRSVTLPTDVRAQLCQFSGLVHSQIKVSYLLINLGRKTCLKILQDLAFILILFFIPNIQMYESPPK